MQKPKKPLKQRTMAPYRNRTLSKNHKIKPVNKLRIVLTTLILFFSAAAFAQTDIKSVDVKSLSQSEIEQIIEQMRNSGLSEQEAISLARQRGATEQQIQDFQNRVQQLTPGDTTTAPVPQAIVDVRDIPESTRAVPVKKTNVFGSYLFNNENLTFEPGLNIQTPKDYEIGIGDEIIINIWGNSQNDYQLSVNLNGQILIPDIGPVYVAGLTFNDAEQKIKKRLTSIYADMGGENPQTFAQVNLGQLRSIQVNLVGEVVVPGTYTLPVTSTLFNALYLSGGPNAIGSFRTIKIIRDKKIFKEVDIYKFLVDADPSGNIQLKNQDLVFVPPLEKQVQTTGEFKRNGLFELKEEETLEDMIQFAGGFTGNSYFAGLQIRRLTQEGVKLIDVPYNKTSTVMLENGDVVWNGAVKTKLINHVAINGAVNRPGTYEWSPGMTLTDLIHKADSLKDDAFLDRALIIRLNPDSTTTAISVDLKAVISGEQDVSLEKKDVVLIKSHFALAETPYITVTGEVQNPGEFKYSEQLTLNDALFIAGGFTEAANNNFIEIARRLSYEEEAELTDTLVHLFTTRSSRNFDDPGGEFLLQPYDRINVRQAPGYRQQGTVSVSGEVKYAGPFSINFKGLQVSDLVAMAGGLTPEAFIRGATLRRETEELGLEYVAIDLETILKNPGGQEDLFLRDRDHLYIPKFTQTVKVTGSVQNPFSLIYEKGKPFKYYIDKSGGFERNALKRKAYIQYPNRTTATARNLVFFKDYPKVMPGSTIVVPEKPERDNSNLTATMLAVVSTLSTLAIALSQVLK